MNLFYDNKNLISKELTDIILETMKDVVVEYSQIPNKKLNGFFEADIIFDRNGYISLNGNVDKWGIKNVTDCGVDGFIRSLRQGDNTIFKINIPVIIENKGISLPNHSIDGLIEHYNEQLRIKTQSLNHC